MRAGGKLDEVLGGAGAMVRDRTAMTDYFNHEFGRGGGGGREKLGDPLTFYYLLTHSL